MVPTYTTAEGALYELVARGKKDAFFYQDSPSSLFPFDNSYESQAPASSEIRRVPPSTACEFGRTVSFDFDLIGDILRNPTFVINLPSWLPPSIIPSNTKTIVTDMSGISYGYTQNIAYFLFDSIQFYQDNILIQEFSGDALWATQMSQGNYGHSFLTAALTGHHDGTPLSIGRNATPLQLRLSLPIVGCQSTEDSGFPQRAAQSHKYKLRCKLRRLEDLIESSDGRMKPFPWNRKFKQVFQDDSVSTFNTIKKEEMPPLDIRLETEQVYLPSEYQEELKNKKQKVVFYRHWENTFTQTNVDYIGVLSGGTSAVKRLLDGCHPSGRLLWFFRSRKAINANQLWKINTGLPYDSYYNRVGLQIAGKDRELLRSPLVWRDITNFAKEEIDTSSEMNTMNWGLGSIAPLRFSSQPTGSINFTTADRPTLYIELAVPDDENTELKVIVEGWARFDTDGTGRAELFSAN